MNAISTAEIHRSVPVDSTGTWRFDVNYVGAICTVGDGAFRNPFLPRTRTYVTGRRRAPTRQSEENEPCCFKTFVSALAFFLQQCSTLVQ